MKFLLVAVVTALLLAPLSGCEVFEPEEDCSAGCVTPICGECPQKSCGGCCSGCGEPMCSGANEILVCNEAERCYERVHCAAGCEEPGAEPGRCVNECSSILAQYRDQLAVISEGCTDDSQCQMRAGWCETGLGTSCFEPARRDASTDGVDPLVTEWQALGCSTEGCQCDDAMPGASTCVDGLCR